MESKNDRLEEFFRRTLGEPRDKPSGNGWDVPSGKVWEGIEAGITQGGKSRRPLFIKYVLIALVVLLLSVIAFQWWTYDEKMEGLTRQVHEQTAAIEKLQKELDAKDAVGPVSAGDRAGETGEVHLPANTESAGGRIAAQSLANQKNVPTASAAGFETMAEKGAGNSAPATTPVGAVASNEHPIANPPKKQTEETPNSSASENQMQQQVGLDGKESTAEGYGIAPPPAGLPSKWPVWSIATPPLILNGTLQPLALDATSRPPVILNAHFSPAYAWRSLRYKITDETTPFEKTESPELSYVAGLLAGMDVSKRWRIYSGVSYQRFHQASKHTIGLRYTTDQAVTDQHGDLVNTYQADLQTSFGEAEVAFRVANDAASSEPDLNEGRIFPVRFLAEEGLDHFGIPVLVEYRMGSDRLNIVLKGGVVGNFLVGKSIRITDVRTMHPRLISRKTDVAGTRFLRNINSFTLDAQVSAGVHLGLSDRLSLTLEPTLRSNLTPVFENERLETRMFFLALNTGLSVRW